MINSLKENIKDYFKDSFPFDYLMDAMLTVLILIVVAIVIGLAIYLYYDLTPQDNSSNRNSMVSYVRRANVQYKGIDHIKAIEYNKHTDNLTVITNKELPTITVMVYNNATKTSEPEQETDTDSPLYKKAYHIGEKVIENSPAKNAKNHVND